MQARPGNLFLGLAETHFNAALIRLNGVDRLDADKRHNDEKHDKECTAVKAAGHDVAQPVLAATNDVLQIGRPTIAAVSATATAWTVGTLSPRPLIIAAAAAPPGAAAILIAPGHQNLFVRVTPTPRHPR